MRDLQSIAILLQLHPKVRPDFQAFIEECEKQYDITLRISSPAFRTIADQAKIYAIGRTTAGMSPTAALPMGEIITDAPPGSSYHNYGLATDLGIVLANGSISYNFDYGKFANIGEQWGITWGGNFPGKFKDYDHFEEQCGYGWRALYAMYQAKDFISGTEFVNL